VKVPPWHDLIFIRSNPRWQKISKGHISATIHPIDFVCGNLKECISGMGYPSHLHEIERSFAGIWERIMCKE